MKHFAILILAVVASAVVMAYPERDSAKEGNQEQERALHVKVQKRTDGDADYDEYEEDGTTPTPDPTAPTAKPRLRGNKP
uniref:Thrombin inhibitor madanin 1 n=2 Tax=Haemaphysalis longicornis TaxID=44386 RepID=Q86FP9_HAELO|nr:thrombin inhibitor madanin 1 [Haemaphysalis longicornis]